VILAIALDEDVDAVRRCAREEPPVPLTYPVLVDRDHLVAEQYGIVNVPATVWIDEDGRIVRPVSIAPADNKFQDFTKIDAAVHNDALRAWVREGVLPLDDAAVRARLDAPSFEIQQARAERRLGMHLVRAGHPEAGERHLATAMTLAPGDFTIHRGSMPVLGKDPFGQDFFDFYQAWEDKGRPEYEV
jgi:hypothetical protein